MYDYRINSVLIGHKEHRPTFDVESLARFNNSPSREYGCMQREVTRAMADARNEELWIKWLGREHIRIYAHTHAYIYLFFLVPRTATRTASDNRESSFQVWTCNHENRSNSTKLVNMKSMFRIETRFYIVDADI